MNIIAILAATAVWFVLAGVLFFNPIVDKVYRSQDKEPGVKAVPPSGKSIVMIFIVILIQVIGWAFVYSVINGVLPGGKLEKGLFFGLILVLTKMIPRDTDRLLISTYPKKRMLIEFIIGSINCFAVGMVFGILN